jgi:16S rRNA (guanine527-N7)-methyltransferase
MTTDLSQAQRLLNSGLTALTLSATANQRAQWLAFLGLIEKWNRVYNLTAIRKQNHMLPLHLMDSLAILPPLVRAKRLILGAHLLDVGSGAGLPGVVLAIAHPDVQITCVDAVGKKATFIRQVAAELGLGNLRAEHARVEQLPSLQADVVVSRAFASLFDFTTLTRHHLKPNGVWVAMKGKAPTEELALLPPKVQMFHVEQIQVPHLVAERCLVWMRPDAQ